jgi:hypothetical protein
MRRLMPQAFHGEAQEQTRTVPALPPGDAASVSGAVLERGWAHWLRQQWPRVTIGEVKLRSELMEERQCVCVEAYVQLGALLPVDVDVRVARTRRSGGEQIPAGEWPMFSQAAMHNGEYLFVAGPIRRIDDAECMWTVLVSPARAVTGLWPTRVSRTVGDAAMDAPYSP